MSTYYKHEKHKGLGKFIQLYRDTLGLGKSQVIIIYQMGKVGSSSIRDTLLNLQIGSVFHLHYFLPWRHFKSSKMSVEPEIKKYIDVEIDHAKRSFKKYDFTTRLKAYLHEMFFLKPLYNYVIKKKNKAKFIVTVRDPISVNMSMFFQRFEQYAGKPYDKANLTTNEILDIFLKKYIFSWPITWFDKEFKTHTGIDVYKHPFPLEKGYTIIKAGNWEVLLLRVELDNNAKETALMDFLNLDSFVLSGSNIGDNKVYANQYNEFKKKVKLSKGVAKELLNSKYAKHFYSDEERETILTRWTQN